MNVSDGSGGSGKGGSQDFDLNLAPIIDCFTVLITFMLASASFLAVGILDASVASNGPPPPDAKPPALKVDVELGLQKDISLKVNGKTKLEKKLPPLNGEWNSAALVQELTALKRQWPDTRSMTLNAHDDVEYLQVIKIMEAVKPQIPVVLLGGL